MRLRHSGGLIAGPTSPAETAIAPILQQVSIFGAFMEKIKHVWLRVAITVLLFVGLFFVMLRD